MRIYADKALPLIIGAAPVVVVVALALLLVVAPQGVSHSSPQVTNPHGLSVIPAGSNNPASPPSSGGNPQPASPGGQGGTGGGQGGLCLPFLGCV